MKWRDTEVLVIGSGIAGLTFALKVAEHAQVTIATKKRRADSNTNYAQGGIAAVMSEDDAVELHVRDTLEAGAGLCHEEEVRGLVAEGPARVRELMDWGVEFSRTRAGRLSLGREGGHSRRRIVHAQDLTGREIERALLEAVAADPAIEVLEDHIAVDLLTTEGAPRRCLGALVLDHAGIELYGFRAHFTLLATGGLGRVYRHTTNPSIATGDGLAMAYRAGARVANLEFIQFHPTALYPAGDHAVLISEAVRGEGAVLRTMSGEPVMQRHAAGSLATRDVVAREIDRVLKETGDDHVLLDLSAIPPAEIEARFPNIRAACAERAIRIPEQPVPVVPAAHYACGGVVTGSTGATDLPGLYAAGEVACTGVHGANRLASNSLLEAVVYSHRAAQAVVTGLADAPPLAQATSRVADRAVGARRDDARLQALERELRALMWRDAGIVRADARLRRAERRLRAMRAEIAAVGEAGALDEVLVEARNLADVAHLIVRCASRRKESRGLHYNVDHPTRDDARYMADTVLAADDRETQ